MELIVGVERTSIDILFVVGSPLELAVRLMSVSIFADKFVRASFFSAFSVEGVGFEATSVCKFVRFIVTALGLSKIMHEISVVERPIWEDICSLPMSLAMLKMPNIKRPVVFVHFTQSIRLVVFI